MIRVLVVVKKSIKSAVAKRSGLQIGLDFFVVAVKS